MRLLTLVASAALALPSHTADVQHADSDYHLLQKWQCTSQSMVITQPVTIARDTATWTMASGSIRLMQPVSSGRVTGLVFEGEGRFTMTVPDRVELAQLRRLIKRPDLVSIDEPFSELVFRASDETIDKIFADSAKAPFDANGAAEKRQNHWLIDLRTDVDGRIIAAMLNPGALSITAGMNTRDFGWLTYDYDSSRREEIELIRYARSFPEVWLSLDRPEVAGSDRTNVFAGVCGQPRRHPFRPPAQCGDHGDAKNEGTADERDFRAGALLARQRPPRVMFRHANPTSSGRCCAHAHAGDTICR